MIETKEITKIFEKYLNKKELKNLYLHNRISHNKMLKILKDAQIKKIDIDYNAYGEFLFIVFLLENKLFQAFSLGLHEYRGKIIKDYWEVWWDINDEIYKTFPDIPYNEVLEEINYRQKEIEKLKPYEDDTTAMYNMIADLCDEDAALAELEDFNLI